MTSNFFVGIIITQKANLTGLLAESELIFAKFKTWIQCDEFFFSEILSFLKDLVS